MQPEAAQVTQVLDAAGAGDPQAAEKPLPLVYEELRKLAAQKMANEAPGNTLQPTALVHEAWLRLVGNEDYRWDCRAHFLAAAGEAMRRILIDNARRKNAQKRGAGSERVDLYAVELATNTDDTLLLRINDALEGLGREDPPCAELVKLRFFVGLSNEEAAQAMGVSERTAKRYWTFARAWLYDQLQPELGR